MAAPISALAAWLGSRLAMLVEPFQAKNEIGLEKHKQQIAGRWTQLPVRADHRPSGAHVSQAPPYDSTTPDSVLTNHLRFPLRLSKRTIVRIVSARHLVVTLFLIAEVECRVEGLASSEAAFGLCSFARFARSARRLLLSAYRS